MQEKRIYRVGSCRVENFGIRKLVACENIPFSSLFAAGEVSFRFINMEFLSLSRRRSSARNVPIDEERGERDVFAG